VSLPLFADTVWGSDARQPVDTGSAQNRWRHWPEPTAQSARSLRRQILRQALWQSLTTGCDLGVVRSSDRGDNLTSITDGRGGINF
jgi:hypothetical protein